MPNFHPRSVRVCHSVCAAVRGFGECRRRSPSQRAASSNQALAPAPTFTVVVGSGGCTPSRARGPASRGSGPEPFGESPHRAQLAAISLPRGRCSARSVLEVAARRPRRLRRLSARLAGRRAYWDARRSTIERGVLDAGDRALHSRRRGRASFSCTRALALSGCSRAHRRAARAFRPRWDTLRWRAFLVLLNRVEIRQRPSPTSSSQASPLIFGRAPSTR